MARDFFERLGGAPRARTVAEVRGVVRDDFLCRIPALPRGAEAIGDDGE